MKRTAPRFSRASLSLSACLSLVAAATLLIPAAPQSIAQDSSREAAHLAAPVKAPVHILKASTQPRDLDAVRTRFNAPVAVQPVGRIANTGGGTLSYTCDPNVGVSTCSYLNTTVAGWYNSSFTNANANIYIEYGTTGLGQSTPGYYNFISYSQYAGALTSNSNKSSVQTSALSALNTYDATPYGSDYVSITSALGTALGMTGLAGVTSTYGYCVLPSSGCYNGIITVTNDPGTPLYYDDQGGTEPDDAYDYYGVVAHETDEVLGTSSCIDTQGSSGLADDCDAATPAGGPGTPAPVDLYRYSSAGELVLDASLSTTAGAYFSYDGGTTNALVGKAGTAKFYNTLDNGDDYADYVAVYPDCGANAAVQDATGCPGGSQGLSILNDGGSEIKILNTIGYDVPFTAGAPATMTSPAPSSTLTSSSVTFTWTAGTNVSQYLIHAGTTGAGSSNIANTGSLHTTTTTIGGIPTTGGTLNVRLYSYIAGAWQYNDYTYTEGSSVPAVMSTPAPSSTLTASSVTFTWTAGNNVSQYLMHVGTTGAGSSNIANTGSLHTTSTTITGIPTSGGTLNVRLYSYIAGAWQFNDYTYTEGSPALAVMSTPAPDSVLTASSVTFTWTAGNSVTQYLMHVGTAGAGSSNIANTGSLHTTSTTITGIPTIGGTLYVRLYSYIAGAWQYNDYVYTEFNAATPAVMTSPASGSTLSGSSVTFTWTAGTDVSQYLIHVGTTGEGSSNIDNTGSLHTTSTTITGIPTTGGTLYVRLYSYIDGAWNYNDYTYVEK